MTAKEFAERYAGRYAQVPGRTDRYYVAGWFDNDVFLANEASRVFPDMPRATPVVPLKHYRYGCYRAVGAFVLADAMAPFAAPQNGASGLLTKLRARGVVVRVGAGDTITVELPETLAAKVTPDNAARVEAAYRALVTVLAGVLGE